MTLFADVFETFGNAALGLDPASGERLRALEGRSIRVVCTAPQQVLSLIVHDARIHVIAEPTDAPNVIVRGSTQDLLAWFADPRQASQTKQRVAIEGDETTLIEIMDVFKRVAPGALPFQDLLGAAEIAIASIRSAVEGATSAVQQSVASHYVDENRANAFLDGMDDLRLRVDRLTARVNAAEQAGK